MGERINQIYINAYHKYNQAINKISIEDFLVGMIANQIPISFHIEAIKAYAILSRTMLINNLKAFDGRGCLKYKGADVCSEGHCFPWTGEDELKNIWKEDYEKNLSRVIFAVKETEGKIITIKDKPIKPQYHKICGGSTVNSEDILGNRILYLRKVLCDYCNNSEEIINSKFFTINELEEKLKTKIKKQSYNWGSPIDGIIEDIVRDDEERITQLKIGDKVFKGSEVAELLGLDSTRFGWGLSTIVFETKGKGHGLGLCQEGSNRMAANGYLADEILKYYFTGIEISNIDPLRINIPLYGKTIVVDAGHGGIDGDDNIGPTGLREKDVNLKIALELKSRLDKEGAQVHLTREEDRYITLIERKELADSVRPDFFISIHQNSFSNPAISGLEIYHYRGDKEGSKLAQLIRDNMVSLLEFNDRGIKTADFYLLREIKSSALHVEVAYITNPEQEKMLYQQQYIEKIADAILKALEQYYM